jgi:hypothetical protein
MEGNKRRNMVFRQMLAAGRPLSPDNGQFLNQESKSKNDREKCLVKPVLQIP